MDGPLSHFSLCFEDMEYQQVRSSYLLHKARKRTLNTSEAAKPGCCGKQWEKRCLLTIPLFHIGCLNHHLPARLPHRKKGCWLYLENDCTKNTKVFRLKFPFPSVLIQSLFRVRGFVKKWEKVEKKQMAARLPNRKKVVVRNYCKKIP